MSEKESERCWDHEDCPLDDCDGELQQQDKFNVMCLDCEAVFSHYRRGCFHWLKKDFETVAKKKRAVTDGGGSLECEACGMLIENEQNLSPLKYKGETVQACPGCHGAAGGGN